MSSSHIGLQLYSVRDHLTDLDGTLGRIADLGIETVEPFSVLDRPQELASALRAHGLSAPTAHAPFLSDEIEYMGRTVPLPPAETMFGAALAVGAQTLFDPMVPAHRWTTREDVEATARRLNAAAEQAAGFGLDVGLHHHSFEFHMAIDGMPAYEYLVSLLDPRVVLEVDLFYAAVAGQDVAALIERLGDRVRALHIKDGPVNVDPFASGAHDPSTAVVQCAAGEGSVPLAEALAAAPATRLEIIEFENVAGDVFEAIEHSIGFLKAHAR